MPREVVLEEVLSKKFAGNSDYQAVIQHAGKMLARHCVGLLQSLTPEVFLLTGPLGRNQTYCDGFRTMLAKYDLDIEVITALDQKFNSPAEAASVFALERHVYSPSFDLRPLLDKVNHKPIDYSRESVL